MNDSVRRARDINERIVAAFEKLPMRMMTGVQRRETSALWRAPQPGSAADGWEVPHLRSRQVASCIYNSSFDPQGCLFLAEVFLGFKRYFTLLHPV